MRRRVDVAVRVDETRDHPDAFGVDCLDPSLLTVPAATEAILPSRTISAPDSIALPLPPIMRAFVIARFFAGSGAAPPRTQKTIMEESVFITA